MAEQLDWLVWLWEGSWRLLSAHGDAAEARRVVVGLKADGDEALCCRRDSGTDVLIRADLHRRDV